MVLDYSKWDKIELSDDSDIEVHPNVDKRSFINAKRRQIQEQRMARKQQITYLGVEIAMNSYLLEKVNRLIAICDSHGSQPQSDVLMQALLEMSSEEGTDAPPLPPDTPSYSQMMAQLVDTIKKEVDEEKPADTWKAFIQKMKEHKEKLSGVLEDSRKRLVDLEKEDKAKITSDDLHEGFSSGHVNKETPAPKAPAKKVTQKVQAVEQLNSVVAPPAPGDQSISSGAEADLEEDASEEGDEEHIEPTALGREFSKIPIGNYQKCMEFVSRNPAVVAEKETDGLLIEAFNSQIAGKDVYAKQCVHQALLLQYCRQLGRDGVSLFFRRITTPNHQAQKVFHEDVNNTYGRIRERAKEIAAERANNQGGVEQIQLHAVEPGTSINITVPPAGSDDPELKKSRELFESFPPGLQRALDNGSLDDVNKVLGKMSVEEAEEVVAKLSEGGMLSVESQIIDATTEDGQKMLDELEKEEKRAAEGAGAGKGKEVLNPLVEEID